MKNNEVKENLESPSLEEIKYSDKLIEELLKLIKKEKNISLVSETLGLTDFEVLGLVH